MGIYTVMNKTRMSQTWLYSIFYQKATGFLQQLVALAIVGHNTNLATVHSQVTVSSCSVEYEYKLLCQFTKIVGTTGVCSLNRARATHCRNTRSVFDHISKQNKAAVAQRLLDTPETGTN